MSLILSIDTALPLASVGLANDGNLLTERISEQQKEHAAFLHPAIESMLMETGITLKDLNAISVTIGPGSYTGLRVGLASAKGLCFALQKPLIALCTLETIALQTSMTISSDSTDSFYCPMIDARRMEVFTALFGSSMSCIVPPHANILHPASFQEYLTNNIVYFSGNGSDKFMEIVNHRNAHHKTISSISEAMAKLGCAHFDNRNFAPVKTVEPNYLKAYQV
jgi:tRNA threonylcarbamoyladenosine biosynthesis protein TsaB